MSKEKDSSDTKKKLDSKGAGSNSETKVKSKVDSGSKKNVDAGSEKKVVSEAVKAKDEQVKKSVSNVASKRANITPDKNRNDKDTNVNKNIGVVKAKITRNVTISTSHKDVKKKWILIDAKDAVVGRLGAYIVHRLRGKHLSTYTPHTDDGDKIVVINCDKIKFTGKKENSKLYRDHSQYVGNVRVRTAHEVREGKRPCDLLRVTVERMIGRCRMSYKAVSKNLYLYAGADHGNVAQNPVVVDFASMNRKNIVR